MLLSRIFLGLRRQVLLLSRQGLTRAHRIFAVSCVVCWFSLFPGEAFSANKKGGDILQETQTSSLDQKTDTQKWATEIASAPVSLNTFYECLKLTYENNPTILAARAEFYAILEEIPKARAGWLPDIELSSSMVYNKTDSGDGGFANFSGAADNGNLSKDVSVNVEQNLYRGGRTQASMQAARNIITAQQARTENVEQSVLLQAATAYMDVYRDETLLELSKTNHNVTALQMEATQDRFSVGELTKTDVSQAEARLAKAEADVITARGNLRISQARYEQIVGEKPPQNLHYPEIYMDLPASLETVSQLAETENLNVIQAKAGYEAAEQDVDGVFGELLPSMVLSGSLTASEDPQPGFLDDERSGSLSLVARMPLYQSGATRARIRERKHLANQRYIQILEATRAAHQETIQYWQDLETAKAEIRSRKAQVSAAAIAQEGVSIETEFGQRTVLDALNADQEYLDAEAALIAAKRNEIVALFSLAKTLGILTARNLGFSDIERNYRVVTDNKDRDFVNFIKELSTYIEGKY